METNILGIVSFLFTMALEEDLKKIRRNKGLNTKIEFVTSDSKKAANEYIEKAKSFEELPDMLIRTDYRGLFEKNTKEALAKGIFENVNSNTSFLNYNIVPQINNKLGITMLGSKQWVIVVDRSLTNDTDIPQHWSDLLKEKYKNKICLQGKDGRYCGTLLLHIHKDFGKVGIQALARNTKNAWHFTKMIKSFGKGNPLAAPINIMPLSNASMILNKEAAQIIWPEEGALSTPVYMLVKKNKVEELRDYINYMTGEAFEKMLVQNHIYSVRSKSDKKLRWLGWDYIYEVNKNLETHKEELNEIFKKELTIE